ncbi:MAG TPA: radical SAM protein, partial [Cytophagales bacterium]|nr:radical SAM protein [Cytophagales bacterium]
MKIILFNPRSARAKHRIPNSILQVAASIHGKWEYVLVDGNLEKDPWKKIESYIQNGFNVFGCTVMPGPQLQQAIPFTLKVREKYSHVINIWGGYFAANQYSSVLKSDAVDYVINGPGDDAFPRLLEALEKNESVEEIQNLIYKKDERINQTTKAALGDQDLLPQLPYESLNSFYPIKKYLGKTFLGKHTAAYHSSMGCPFTCSFCAVVPLYNARWKGKSDEL